MSNPLIIGAKLNHKRNALAIKVAEIAEATKRSEELVTAIDDATTEEEIEVVEKSVDENQTEIDTKEGEKSALETEISELEAKLEELNKKSPDITDNQGGKRQMANNNEETREGIKAYIRSKGQERAGFTSVEGGALIPIELLTPQKELVDTLDLTKYIRTVKVNRGSGKYPVIKKSVGKMISVAELALNPELAKPTFVDVTYDIETYRGYIPVSQEVIDDADYDVAGLIAEDISGQDLNTKNAEIAAILKTAPAKAVTGLDGIITLFNKDIKQVYAVRAYLSSSLFNALDLLKDTTGRYLLTDDITVASGKRIKGKEIVVLDDDVIGTIDGNLVGFVGDAKEFITLFDRKQASVKWTDNDVYGQLLAGFVRFDVKAVDTAAGFYITYTASV